MSGLYSALGILRSASEVDVRSAYRRRALATHPDKGGTSAAFRVIVDAFETIGDAARRADYDALLERSASDDGLELCGGQGARLFPRKRPQEAAAATLPKQRPAAPSEVPAASPPSQPRAVDASSPSAARPKKRQGSKKQKTSQQHEASPQARSPPSSQADAGAACPDARGAEPTADCPASSADGAATLLEELESCQEQAWSSSLTKLAPLTLRKLIRALNFRVTGGGAKSDEVGAEQCREADDGEFGGCPQEECGNSAGVMGRAASASSDAVSCRVLAGDALAIEFLDSLEDMPRSVSREKEPTNPAVSAAREADVTEDPPSNKRRTLMSGITRQVLKDKTCSYSAEVSLFAFRIRSLTLKTLDEAIEYHINLIQLRQRVRSLVRNRTEFSDALRKALAEAPSLRLERLSFLTKTSLRGKRRTLCAPQTRDLETAIWCWEIVRATIEDFSEAAWSEAHKEMSERAKRIATQRLNHEWLRRKQAHDSFRSARQAVRTSRQRAANLQQARRERRKRLQQMRDTRRRLLAALRRQLQASLQQRKGFLKRWGVEELPIGFDLGRLHSENDSICCVIQMSDSPVLYGPLRRTLAEAQVDRRQALAIQRARGDEAMRAELERRDVEAMTKYFMQEA